MQRLTHSLDHPPKTWGIIVLAVWAVVLAVTSIANVLLLSRAATQLEGGPDQSRIWLVFGFNVFFIISFGLSAYGLWQTHNWGRLLFLAAIGLWSGFGLVAFLWPTSVEADQAYTFGEQALNLLRYGISFVVPIIYLNLAHIKAYFLTGNDVFVD